ncbi:MAG: LCP family protein [Bacilli bacterium]|nr:LCP family protein [Bacilli bacterium]
MKKIKAFIKGYPNKLLLYIISLFFLVYLGSNIYLIYNILLFNDIETIIRYGIIGCLLILSIIFLLIYINIIIRRKKKSFIIYIIVIMLFSSVQLLGTYFINKAYSSINKINKSSITYSTSLITLKTSNIKKVSDLKDKKIGIIKDKENIEGYIISQLIIKENNIDKDTLVEYEDFLSMIKDLYDDDLDAIFISSNYSSMFSSIDSFEKIADETKVIVSKEKTMAKEEESKTQTNKKLSEPFTVLIMGVDSTLENINTSSAFNGDALMLVTFNPKNLNATILSIPRDTFVPIMCFANNKQNKITHAAWQGENCMMSTIENFTGIDIDYYVKINFKGVVNLVDAVGGVEVDVPITFCEQNSNREWGNKTIYIKKGLQKLNGEQALAFSRHRKDTSYICGNKNYKDTTSNDFTRGLHQQLVIDAIINKVKNISDINKIYDILDIVQKSMDTNMTTNQILSFYDVLKDIVASTKNMPDSDLIFFEKLYLSGNGEMIYDESMKLVLYDYIYSKESLKNDVKAMKVNLGLIEPTLIKEFSFSINEPYEQQTIGKGPYSSDALLPLVPNFTNFSKQFAINWGTTNGVKITFVSVDSTNSAYTQNQVIKQSVHSSSLISMVNKNTGIVLTVVNKTTSATTSKTNCSLSENSSATECTMQDFTNGNKISEVNAWENSVILTGITINKVAVSSSGIEGAVVGDVFEQTESSKNTKVTDLPSSITIKYYTE